MSIQYIQTYFATPIQFQETHLQHTIHNESLYKYFPYQTLQFLTRPAVNIVVNKIDS